MFSDTEGKSTILAFLLGEERQEILFSQLFLVGFGTTDFSVVRVKPRVRPCTAELAMARPHLFVLYGQIPVLDAGVLNYVSRHDI